MNTVRGMSGDAVFMDTGMTREATSTPLALFISAMRQRWPSRLWLVRHGESAGNVARAAADVAGVGMIDLTVRDVDVPLSPLGERQADALGRWFAAMDESERPEVILSSPYVRARQTG